MIILLKRGEETITYPCGSYGNIGNPTLAMLLEMGFVEFTPPPPPPPTPAEIIAATTAALERFYDETAQSRRYDNRLTCALRAGYPSAFHAECYAFAIWMDSCNAYAYQVQLDCQAGLRGVPTIEELLAELPVLVW